MLDMVVEHQDGGMRVNFEHTDGVYDEEQLWRLLRNYDKAGCVLAAGSTGEDETLTEGRGPSKGGGIVPGHAYAILKVL